MIPEEMNQTLLRKETWTKYTLLTLLSQRKLALSTRNTFFALSLEHLNNFKKLALSPIYA
jgi:hypothetical protein